MSKTKTSKKIRTKPNFSVLIYKRVKKNSKKSLDSQTSLYNCTKLRPEMDNEAVSLMLRRSFHFHEKKIPCKGPSTNDVTSKGGRGVRQKVTLVYNPM